MLKVSLSISCISFYTQIYTNVCWMFRGLNSSSPLLCRDDPLSHSFPFGQPLLHVHWLRPQQHRARSSSPHHPGVCLWNLLHPLGYTDLLSSRTSCHVPVLSSFRPILNLILMYLFLSGLALVVGLVLYISSINDEMLNRTKSSEAYFTYKYGWSFAFAAISFLLTEVSSCP